VVLIIGVFMGVNKVNELAKKVLDEIITEKVGVYDLTGNQAVVSLTNGGRFVCNVESQSWIRVMDEHNIDVKGWSIAKFQNEVYEMNNAPKAKVEKVESKGQVAEAEEALEELIDKEGTIFDPEIHDVTSKGNPRKVFGVWAKKK
jgi:hypothetical protein